MSEAEPNNEVKRDFDTMFEVEKGRVLGLRNVAFRPLDEEPDFFGLALSGGGIRSATFSLGVIQALAFFRRLRQIDYLSTVSGGGYVGSWLSASLQREIEAIKILPPEDLRELGFSELDIISHQIHRLSQKDTAALKSEGLSEEEIQTYFPSKPRISFWTRLKENFGVFGPNSGTKKTVEDGLRIKDFLDLASKREGRFRFTDEQISKVRDSLGTSDPKTIGEIDLAKKFLASAIARVEHGVGVDPRVKKRTDDSTGGTNSGEAATIRHLRDYSNYLTPRLGALSRDTLALMAGIIRNSVIIMFLGLILIALAISAFHFVLAVVPSWIQWTDRPVDISLPFLPQHPRRILIYGIVYLFLFVGYISWLLTLSAIPEKPEPAEGKKPEPAERAGVIKTALIKTLNVVALFLVIASLICISTWFTIRAPPLKDAYLYYFLSLIYISLGVIIFDFIGTASAYLAAGNPLRALLRAWRLFFSSGTALINIAVAFASRVFGAFIWILILVALGVIGQQGDGEENQLIGKSIALGPGFALIGIWLIYISWMGALGKWYTESTREILSRFFGQLTGYALLWLAVGGATIYAQPIWRWISNELVSEYGFALVASLTAAVLIALVLLRLRPRERKSSSRLRQQGERTPTNVVSLSFAVTVLLVLTILYQKTPRFMCEHLLSSFSMYRQECQTIAGTPGPEWLGAPALYILLFVVILVIALFAAWRIDINIFSLQNIYCNRLVRCYLGASNSRRNPDFAGFDAKDDLELRQFEWQRPYHLINAALNLTKGEDLGWQERKAASFLFSPLYCGYSLPSKALAETLRPSKPRGKYIKTYRFAGEPKGSGGQLSQGVMVGTAMATSGAAVSPLMGYASQVPRAFPLTLLNLRLGRWVPNPNLGTKVDSLRYAGIYYFLEELILGTNERGKWVYLSDGGHFENLGIYELVRRRCRRIIAVDAGADPHRDFGDLGKAIHKCRVDFGVDIEINTEKLGIDADGRSESAIATGRINYPEKKPEAAFMGTLIYIKPSIPQGWDNLGEDVLAYRAQHPEFPHEPTADQWFSESQFESYRYLGYLIGRYAVQRLDT